MDPRAQRRMDEQARRAMEIQRRYIQQQQEAQARAARAEQERRMQQQMWEARRRQAAEQHARAERDRQLQAAARAGMNAAFGPGPKYH